MQNMVLAKILLSNQLQVIQEVLKDLHFFKIKMMMMKIFRVLQVRYQMLKISYMVENIITKLLYQKIQLMVIL